MKINQIKLARGQFVQFTYNDVQVKCLLDYVGKRSIQGVLLEDIFLHGVRWSKGGIKFFRENEISHLTFLDAANYKGKEVSGRRL